MHNHSNRSYNDKWMYVFYRSMEIRRESSSPIGQISQSYKNVEICYCFTGSVIFLATTLVPCHDRRLCSETNGRRFFSPRSHSVKCDKTQYTAIGIMIFPGDDIIIIIPLQSLVSPEGCGGIACHMCRKSHV